ncbi:leucine Rich repeat-containing domain protein [Necator americanus]|nr:leucine Rich repeat-containing domain protein [Necator americanus]ETN69996.1 leucine Rich repeat-containing domain protein [Necator americanus]
MWLIYVIFVSVFPSVLVCPSMCLCSDDGRADCSNRGLTEVPTDFPPSITVLDLRGNALEVLGRSSFAGLEESIIHIDLSRNNLRSIDSNAFRNLKRLRTLNLRRNHLRSIPKALDELQLIKLDL